ncbi:hypothetical protein BCR37DRAFT_60748 [Protomyces lactucae-debilis]|uniref:Fe2OG dioxygenase domain-containing protein n=1 Tax=Protomyces lactucae-debilis TaxID=2754530 RepID=A0A1Y2FAP6_PROLT|nr:uncharacterized protein BCR37DRAFT_60748 [Protomyces lactucae-debilis]ORY80992.1 hypothetical protein BCR37DRAFT_60748 [Protomyces lactucae-debilis]
MQTAAFTNSRENNCLDKIDGLVLIQDAISAEYADQLLRLLPREVLVNDNSQLKTPQGSSSTASVQMHHFSPLPDYLTFISEDVIPDDWKTEHWQGFDCEAAIIQRYKPGQGIDWHVDLLRFDDGIAILSLLSSVRMLFRRVDHRSVTKSVVLHPRSLLLISGHARYKWEHCIESIESDIIDGQTIARRDRISITMRRVKDKHFA